MNQDLSLFEHVVLESVTPKTLFLLHGTGGTKTDFLFLNELLGRKFTLVGLTGNVVERGMRRFFERYEEGVFNPDSVRAESAKLYRFIAAWVKTHYLRTEDTAFLGYSNGANILLSTLFPYPSHFATLVLLHPMLPMDPPDGLTLSGTSVFVSYGNGDTMVVPEQSRRVVEALSSRGAQVSSHEYPGGHAVSKNEIDDVVAYLRNTVQ